MCSNILGTPSSGMKHCYIPNCHLMKIKQTFWTRRSWYAAEGALGRFGCIADEHQPVYEIYLNGEHVV